MLGHGGHGHNSSCSLLLVAPTFEFSDDTMSLVSRRYGTIPQSLSLKNNNLYTRTSFALPAGAKGPEALPLRESFISYPQFLQEEGRQLSKKDLGSVRCTSCAMAHLPKKYLCPDCTLWGNVAVRCMLRQGVGAKTLRCSPSKTGH